MIHLVIATEVGPLILYVASSRKKAREWLRDYIEQTGYDPLDYQIEPQKLNYVWEAPNERPC